MKKHKNINITNVPASFGMSLRAFCEVFGLNYICMRKAAGGHQELSAEQLSYWLKAKQFLAQCPTSDVPEQKTTAKGEKQWAKHHEEHAFALLRLQREHQAIGEKLVATRRGIAALKAFRTHGEKRAVLVAEIHLQTMIMRRKALQQELELTDFKMHQAQCAVWYYESKQKKTAPVISTPSPKKTRTASTSLVRRTQSLRRTKKV